MTRVCSIEGCGAVHLARGWCIKHYAAWKRHGDPLASRADRVCSIEGCEAPHIARGWCDRHYKRWQTYGDPLIGKEGRTKGAGCIRADGYIVHVKNGIAKLAHVLVAEKALGKPLPPGAIVHHVDENPSNNDQTNLVICPDAAYHNMIHRRMKAMEATGNPDFMNCQFCHQYDDPARMVSRHNGTRFVHRICELAYRRDHHKLRKSQ